MWLRRDSTPVLWRDGLRGGRGLFDDQLGELFAFRSVREFWGRIRRPAVSAHSARS
jgi:hypothetical protein